MPPRSLSESDKREWAKFALLIKPLPGKPTFRAADLPAPASVLPPWPKPPSAIPAARAKPAAVAIGGQPAGVDKATWQRFRSGKLLAARRLDLHGMTAQHAFRALSAFLRTAHAEQQRCVEVITGRGSGESGGVIRREFALWLNLPDIRPLVLAATHPHPANPGSVRLLLRRIR